MTLLTIAGTSFILGLSGAMMPGPLLTVTISETARRGPSAGPLLVAGHAVLEGALVALLFFGLGEVIKIPLVFSAITLVGGVMLLWMAYGMFRSLPTLSLDLSGEEQAGMHPMTAGALVSLSNPYFILWWATVGFGYMVVAHEAGVAGVVTFYLFHILSDLVWYAFIAGAVSYGRRFLSDRAYRMLVGVCALFILCFGVYFGYCGGRMLMG